MPKIIRKLASEKRNKLTVSPIYLMSGAIVIGLLFLGFNVSTLRNILQNHAAMVEASNTATTDNGENLQQQRQQQQQQQQQQEVKQRNAPKQEKDGADEARQGNDNDNDNDSVRCGTGADDGNEDVVQYQIIYSTGCSAFQDWQSYIFFFHAAKILKETKPPLSAMENTHVTRIASGCSQEDAEMMQRLHKEQIEIMTPCNNFHLQLTPDFSMEHGGPKPYKYFNKPYGTKYWMENALGYKKGDENGNVHDNHIIILMDPDQIILRPFTNDFSKQTETWRARTSLPYWDKIVHGQPFAQQYGFHNQWHAKTDISKIAKPEELPSPLESMDRSMINENFSAGPPYMATGRDFYRIADKWAEFVVPVWRQYPYLLGEMFAYCLAAAHLNLPHQIAQSFMISDAGAGGMEGWKQSIDESSEKDVCKKDAIPRERLPNVLHYCQRYWLGKWFIGKYKLPKDFISCHSPLLKVPPDDIAEKYDFAVQPGTGDVKQLDKSHIKRNAYMVCTFIPALNEAARFFKEHHCANEQPNMEETLIFHDTMEIHK